MTVSTGDPDLDDWTCEGQADLLELVGEEA